MDAPFDLSIDVDGVTLALHWFTAPETPSGRTIVLLHQGLGSIRQWRDFPVLLAELTGYAVLAYDRSGHGRSSPMAEPRGPDFIEHEARVVLPALLAALGIARPIVYGHSDGGTIALEFAASFPERPLAVVSEAGHVINEGPETGSIEVVKTAFQETDLRAKLARHHGDKVDEMFDAWAGVWSSEPMRDWQMLDRLPAITCPLLVIQGEGDEHGSMAQVDEVVRRVGGPVEAEVMPGIGHMPHLEAAELVANRVASFLRKALG